MKLVDKEKLKKQKHSRKEERGDADQVRIKAERATREKEKRKHLREIEI